MLSKIEETIPVDYLSVNLESFFSKKSRWYPPPLKQTVLGQHKGEIKNYTPYFIYNSPDCPLHNIGVIIFYLSCL